MFGNLPDLNAASTMKQNVRAMLRGDRKVLLEHELFGLLQLEGLPVPAHRFLPLGSMAGNSLELGPMAGGRGVLKVVSERILHKSDLGCVAFLEQVTPAAVREAARAMVDGLPAELRASVLGVVLERAIPFEPGLGHELLLGLRHSPELGAVFAIGFGGTYVEALAAATLPGQSTILFKPGVTSDRRLQAKLEHSLFFRWASGRVRGMAGLAPADELGRQIQRWVTAMDRLRAAVEACGRTVQELELNPLVWDRQDRVLTPVDALLRVGPAHAVAPAYPDERLRQALRPGSVAIMGVSARGTTRASLRNLGLRPSSRTASSG